ncbi:MAG: hypothetical protein ACLR23_19890 [Clostridia bacterium]
MQHRNTGRNYLMIVNNSFTDRATIALKLDGAVSSLELAGKSDAGTSTWSWENGLLSIQADIGGAYLFALPEGVDFVQGAEQPGAQDNLAPASYITASSSQSSDQFFIKNLIDGERASTASSRGWRTDDGNRLHHLRFRHAHYFQPCRSSALVKSPAYMAAEMPHRLFCPGSL